MFIFNINLISNNFLMSNSIKLEQNIIIPKIKYYSYNITSDKYGIFTQFNLSNNNLEFGFKIHISATIDNYEKVLYITTKYLIKNKISFKYISNKNYLKYILSNGINRSASGKFITIYPKNNSEFKKIVTELYKVLRKYKGQKILTDNCYKNSIINYRFGSFINNNKIVLPSGEIFIDDRKPIYKLPKSIKEPFNQKSSPPKYIGVKYKVFKAIQHKVAGGVYLARDNRGTIVIIKEVRPNIELSNNIDTMFYKKNEKTFLKNNTHPFFPKFIDDFYDCGHYFIVEEFIDGINLSEFKSSGLANINNITKIIENIFKMIKYLHSNGYFIMDISDKNILVDKYLNTYLIDTEKIFKKDNIPPKSHLYRTMGFYSDYIHDKNWKKQDLHQIGYLLLGIFTRANMFLYFDRSGESTINFFKKIAETEKIPYNIVNLILNLINVKYDDIAKYNLNDYSIPEKSQNNNYSIYDLYKTAISNLKKNNIYYSLPDYSIKYSELYGLSGIKSVLVDKIYKLEDLIISNNYYKFTDEFVNFAITNNNFTLKDGLSYIYINLINNKNNTTLINKVENLLIEYIKNVSFNFGDKTGLFDGYLSVLYAISFNEELLKQKDIRVQIKQFVNNFISKCINKSSFNNTQEIILGQKKYSSYISNGISGLLKIIIRINKILNISSYDNLIYSITKDLIKVKYTQNATYSTGMAGIIDALIDAYEYTNDSNILHSINEKIIELNDYIINYNNNYYIPSPKLINFGLDFAGGSAGIIAVYFRYLKIKETQGDKYENNIIN